MFEKKRGTRFLASVMALVMLLSLAPVGALAADEPPTTEESSAVTLPADKADQKPVVTEETNTANTNEETTPPPANEGIAVLPANNNNTSVALPETPVIVKPTEVLDQAVGVDSDTSKDNGIAEYKGNNDGNYVNSEPTATEKMAELWITNAPVTANGSNSVSINSDIDGITTDNGVLVSELAPEKGRSGDNNVVFWQARILDSNHKQMIWQKKQTKEGHEAEAFRCKEITNRSSSYYQLQYKNENNAWTNIKSSDQIVFYYTAVTNLLQDMIQINITDWPRTDGGDNAVTYEVYVDDENTPTNQIITYYNTQDRSIHGRTTVFVDNVSVDMNQLEKYKVKKIERQYANQNAEELSVNNSQSNFSIDLDNGNCTIKIYLERYKYVLSYELNEGSIASGTTYTLAGSYKENETITAPASESMSRAGYTFDGWYMDDALENPWTGDKMPSKDFILYAKWEAKNYTVNYDLNYTDATNSLEAKTDVKWGDNNLLPGGNPSREGFLFDAWYTQPTGGEKVTDATTYASIAGNDATPSVTLYAHWNQDSKPTTEPTPVYVYFKIVDAAGNNIKDKSKINNDDLKSTAYNNDADKKTWATLGKIASAETLTDGTEYTGTNTTLVTVGNEAKNQLKGNALYKDNTGIATTVLANIEWFQLKQWNGATDYVLGGSRWHLDGKITGYTVTYDKGTTEATNDVNNMPVPDKMYYLRGSEYTVSDATPTREGYVFTGWKSDNDNKVYDSESKMIMPAKNVVLTAQWEVDNWKDADNTTDKDSETGGDGIPDCQQILVKYLAIPATEGTVTPAVEVHTLNADKTPITLDGSKAEKVANSNFVFAYWISGTVNDQETADQIEAHAISYNAELSNVQVKPEKGGETYTYTAIFLEDVVGNPDGPDGTPDIWQYKVTFNVVGGNWNDNNNNEVVRYVTRAKGENNIRKAVLGDVPVAGEKPNASHINNGSWTKNGIAMSEAPKVGDEITGPTNYVFTYNTATPVTENTYTVNRNLMGATGAKVKTEPIDTNAKANEGTILENLITPDMQKNWTEGTQNYVYVPAATTFKKGEISKSGTDTLDGNDFVIDLYYYLDNWKDGSSVKEDNEKGGDGIPDCDQVLIKYVSSNSDRGTVSPDMEVLTIRGSDKQPTNKGTVTASGSTATVTGSSRNYFSNWTNNAGLATSSTAKLGQQTFTTEGGKTYTFTANFGYSGGGGSGGSSRPSTPPTVDIPDDVPTGLNGKDHYAYIIGYGNNDVRPQNNITRAEVATIFFRLLTDETREANMTKSNSYNDVKDGDWFCCAVSTLSKMGIIKGYEDGSFKPNDPISRAEFAAIAARFDPDGDKTPATFADVTSHWAKDEISIAANHGWIKGYEDGSFKPDQKITRAETMTLVNRVLNRLPETKDDLHKDMKTWVDNMDETAWYYLAVQEATNSHYFKNKTGTKFEQWTDLRDTRDWSELEK